MTAKAIGHDLHQRRPHQQGSDPLCPMDGGIVILFLSCIQFI